MASLKDKVVIITGASSGIGAGAAVHLGSLGARLVLSGRKEEGLAATRTACLAAGAADSQVLLVQADVSKPEDRDRLVKAAVDKFGGIHSLVNSAGAIVVGPVESSPMSDYDWIMDVNTRSLVALTQLALPHIKVNSAGAIVVGPVESSPMSDYDWIMDVNTRSLVALTQLALPHIKASKGTIVNVSSVNGPCSFPGVTFYCMSKAAVDQFTKCLALEMTPAGVRVNSVNPGVIVTNIHKRGGMDDAAYAAFLERSKTTHALGRPGRVEETAKAIAFLASEDSSFTTGQLLMVDGGRGIMTPR